MSIERMQTWNAQQVQALLDLWQKTEGGLNRAWLSNWPGPNPRPINRWIRFERGPEIVALDKDHFHVTFAVDGVD